MEFPSAKRFPMKVDAEDDNENGSSYRLPCEKFRLVCENRKLRLRQEYFSIEASTSSLTFFLRRMPF